MSTILKALRRLEEDGAKQAVDAVTGAATDPALRASESLRDRIFAEEVAAKAAPSEPATRVRLGPKGMLAATTALGLLVLALGTNWLLHFGGNGDGFAVMKAVPASRVAASASAEHTQESRDRIAADRASAAPHDGFPDSAPVAAQIAAVRAQTATSNPDSVDAASERVGNLANAETAKIAPAQIQRIRPETTHAETIRPETVKAEPAKPSTTSLRPSPAPAARESSLGVAAVTPTAAAKRGVRTDRPAPDPLSLARSTPSPVKEAEPVARPRPKPSLRVVSPAPVSARRVQRAPADAEEPIRQDRLSESLPFEKNVVERIDHRGLPDVVVLRTTWHPAPNRRSASVRLEATGELVTLREGDAIGGLVVREILPSSVLFQAGEVELRRRVGAKR